MTFFANQRRKAWMVFATARFAHSRPYKTHGDVNQVSFQLRRLEDAFRRWTDLQRCCSSHWFSQSHQVSEPLGRKRLPLGPRLHFSLLLLQLLYNKALSHDESWGFLENSVIHMVQNYFSKNLTFNVKTWKRFRSSGCLHLIARDNPRWQCVRDLRAWWVGPEERKGGGRSLQSILLLKLY